MASRRAAVCFIGPSLSAVLACGGANSGTDSSANAAGFSGIDSNAGAAGDASGGGAAGTANAAEGGASAAGSTDANAGEAGSGGSAGINAGGTGGTSGSAGTANQGGAAGAAGEGAAAGMGSVFGNDKPYCLPQFAAVCTPEVTFQNDESAGDGALFDQVIPDAVATMQDVACVVCSILFRNPAEVIEASGPSAVTLHIHDFDGVANAGGGTINFSSRHIANYDDPDEALFEYRGVLLHETTHLYQWDAGGGALVEGMADFVRIRAGHHHLNRRGPGGAWTDAYTTSGFFFSWLAGPGYAHPDGRAPFDADIGWAINQHMKDQWDPTLFVEHFGEDVDTLWAEYQAAIQ